MAAVAAAPVAAPQAGPDDTLKAILEELRALRSDMGSASAAGLRAQLLVARLQVQEQRVNNLVRDLSDAHRRLSAAQSAHLTATEKLRRFEATRQRVTDANEVQAVEAETKILLAQVKEYETSQQQQRVQTDDLTALLSREQSVWIDLSNRLDELERALSQRPPIR